MINLVCRKSVPHYSNYFMGDFGSPMWDAMDGQMLARLSPRRTIVGQGRKFSWDPLSPGEFVDHMAWLSKFVTAGRKRVISVELAFSPPKSFSVAALAGQAPDPRLLELHLRAVETALEMVSNYLFVRKQLNRKKTLAPVNRLALCFTHPWNRAIEPQLHTHVCLDGTPEFKHALDARPLFILQRTIRAYYHYSLVAILKAEGWVVRLGSPGSLLWELQGMHDAVRAAFSKRSAAIVERAKEKEGGFSQAVAERIVALASRRELPKTDPTRSLVGARRTWHDLVHSDRWILPREPQSAERKLAIGDLRTIFAVSSVMTREMAVGRILARQLGSGLPLEEAVAQIHKYLEREVAGGRLIEGPRKTLCHPAIFRSEEGILEHVVNGLGKGRPLSLQPPEGTKIWCGIQSLQGMVRRPDRVRFALLQGEKLPTEVEFQVIGSKEDKVDQFDLPTWNPTALDRRLARTPQSDLVVVIGDVVHKGDFLERIGRIWSSPAHAFLSKRRQLRWGDRVIEVMNEGMDGLVRRLRKGLCGFQSIAFWDRQGIGEVVDRRVFGRQQFVGRILDVDEPVPRELLADFIEWRDASIFAVKQGKFHHHDRWSVMRYAEEGDEFVLKGRKKSKRMKRSDLIALLGSIAVVKARPMLVAPAMQLRIEHDYEEKGFRFRAGELVRVKVLGDDGWITLEDDRKISPSFRLWRPSVVLKEFGEKCPPISHLFISGLQLSLDELLALPWTKQLTIMTKNIPGARERLAGELDDRLQRAHVAKFLQYSGREAGRSLPENEDQEIDADESWNLIPMRRVWAAKIREKEKEQPVPPPTLQWETLRLPEPIKPERLPRLRKSRSKPPPIGPEVEME